MKLSIVVPALNEEETIGLVVIKAIRSIRKLDIEGEVIVSDNGSTDGTRYVAENLGARVVDAPFKGYGNALQAGFAAARGEYILMADGDDSYDLEEIKPFIDKLDGGYEFVMGNRFKGKKIKGAMPFLHRYLGTPVLTFIINVLFQTGIGDVNCGMRAFRRNVYKKINCFSPGMEFACEMVIKASMMKLKITEISCDLFPDKRSRPSHLKTWHDGWRHLKFIVSFFMTERS